MKPNILCILMFFLISIWFLTLSRPVFAQMNDQTMAATTSAPKSLDSQSSANLVISAVETFFKSLDSLSGGFIFTTPDFFTNTITLSNGSNIKGVNVYRNIFYLLNIPLSAFLIFSFSLRGSMRMQMQFIKQFAIRLSLYIFLLVFLVPLLSLSIQFTNILSESILSLSQVKQPSITAFISDYFSAAQKDVSSGKASPEQVGFFNPSFFDMMRSIPNVVTQLLFLVLIVFSLTISIVFIFMQFIVRFLSLLFLSIIFPLITPFIFAEKTEGIVNSFLRIWFTMLIHQPSFVLGFAVVTILIRSMLQGGISIALLFLYVASLFFLGTVNILVSRIFADFWISAGLNLEAGAITRVPINTVSGFTKFLWNHQDKRFNHIKNHKTTSPTDGIQKRNPSDVEKKEIHVHRTVKIDYQKL